MTPEEYERRPEVKAALKLVRENRGLVAGVGWANFKKRLMELLGIHSDQYYTWDVPTEFKYANKRVKSGFSRKDAFQQVVAPDIKAGRIKLDGPPDAPGLSGAYWVPILFHGTLLNLVPAILKDGIERGEGWGGAGTSGAFLSGTPEGALYWAKMAYQREHGEKLEAYSFDRDHGHEIDRLLAVLAVQIPDDQAELLRADEEQFEDVHADFPPEDWRQSLKVIGDVRFDGEVPPEWIVEAISPKASRSGL